MTLEVSQRGERSNRDAIRRDAHLTKSRNRFEVDDVERCPATQFQLVEQIASARHERAIVAVTGREIDRFIDRAGRQQLEGGGLVNGNLPHATPAFLPA